MEPSAAAGVAQGVSDMMKQYYENLQREKERRGQTGQQLAQMQMQFAQNQGANEARIMEGYINQLRAII